MCETRLWARAVDVLLIFVLFFLVAGVPAPDVNEVHYLTKAKHYWQPEWLADDSYLEGRDAHLIFFWTFGWITQMVSLDAAAWIGRLVAWGLLAWACERLVFSVVRQPRWSVLAAALATFGWQRWHLSGEWVVGGAEAKGFAYFFVFFGLFHFVNQRWAWAYIGCGLAAMFHVLVGGWAMVAMSLAWCITPPAPPPPRSPPPHLLPSRPTWPAMLRIATVGCALALPGLIPTLLLNSQASTAETWVGNQIYVFNRLPHHLVIHAFPWFQVVRFGALLALWGWLWKTNRNNPQMAALHRFAAGAVAIGLVGVALDFITIRNPPIAAQWLRYYWYRLPDAVIPLVVAVGLVAELASPARRTGTEAHQRGAKWALLTCLAMAGGHVTDTFLRHRQDQRPPATRQAAARDLLSSPQATQRYLAWRDACQWCREFTPTTARCLVPPASQTFKWYANRSDFVNWKDMPQDARGAIRWRRRMGELFVTALYRDDTSTDMSKVIQLVTENRIDYVLASKPLPPIDPIVKNTFQLVYQNGHYRIYQVHLP